MKSDKIREYVQEIRELTRMKEELENEITALQDHIKDFMTAENKKTLTGIDYKIMWQEYTSNRLDTKSLKEELPKIAERYTKQIQVKRFCIY